MTKYFGPRLEFKNGRLFRVYFNEVPESKMAMDVYQKESIADFQNLKDALRFIELNNRANVADLEPLKGQKVFNPVFYDF